MFSVPVKASSGVSSLVTRLECAAASCKVSNTDPEVVSAASHIVCVIGISIIIIIIIIIVMIIFQLRALC